MIKKFFIVFFSFLFLQNFASSNDSIIFDFPNQGWHNVPSPDGVQYKKCFVPANQSSQNYTEMLTFIAKKTKNSDLSPIVILQKQLGKDKNNYLDINPEFIYQNLDDSMVTWCSQFRNTCVVQRAFKGNENIILAIYTNKAPHYSQNIFGQWPNILSKIKVFSPHSSDSIPENLIEL